MNRLISRMIGFDVIEQYTILSFKQGLQQQWTWDRVTHSKTVVSRVEYEPNHAIFCSVGLVVPFLRMRLHEFGRSAIMQQLCSSCVLELRPGLTLCQQVLTNSEIPTSSSESLAESKPMNYVRDRCRFCEKYVHVNCCRKLVKKRAEASEDCEKNTPLLCLLSSLA